jgi:hypothetical protein
MMKRTLLLGLCALALAAPAAAQIHVPTYTGTPLLITGGVLNQQVLQNAARATSEAAPPREATRVTVGRPMAPRELASHYPASERAKVEALFTDLLQRYRSIEERFAIPRHDLGGAVAAFIAGSHMAYRNEPFPDEHFGPLVQQMRRLLAANPAVAAAPLADRQQAYEQLAILGMFMAGAQIAQREKPDAQAAERLQRAGGEYLERLLAIEPARVQIGPRGLALRAP